MHSTDSMHSKLLQHSLSLLCGMICDSMMCMCADPTEILCTRQTTYCLHFMQNDVSTAVAIPTGLVSEPHGVDHVWAA